MKIITYIEQHKFGILATIVVHVAVFVYFQLATYQEVVIYEPWDFRYVNKEAPDDIELSPDQIITPEMADLMNTPEEVSSFVKNENDSRERSNERDVNYTSYSKGGNPSDIEKNYEQQLKDEIRRQNEAKNGGKPIEQSDAYSEPKKTKPSTEQSSGGAASSKAVSGATLVSYSLDNRHPLNHNDWYVRNPGYTCGNVNGVVKVLITVDEGGKVISASVIEVESSNASPCMLQKAKEYAMMSRFNYDGSAAKKQEGTITYRFVYRD